MNLVELRHALASLKSSWASLRHAWTCACGSTFGVWCRDAAKSLLPLVLLERGEKGWVGEEGMFLTQITVWWCGSSGSLGERVASVSSWVPQ